MNNVALIGRLTKDPVMQSIASTGTQVARLTVAVDRGKNKEGKKEADFINCIAFGKTAETIGKYTSKGKQVGVIGHIQTGSYEKDGKKIYTTDVVIDRLDLLGAGATDSTLEVEKQMPIGFEQIDNDDIPF